ncbi:MULTISPECIES: 23S rRNA (pseudouridine(1915)-N(3))-methyltransferase RlmH [Paeniglutamicibacter]|uniref:Ribosomal RNA large subunit methyltransferase H n=1 Tax=Paeniglutamicibacter sulfureus TaxID=43666 RepID=A0ABU2BH77_9MICC|nr:MULTISPECIES: 23S rRNA (pseudouridine(1915)-N(3))-methyltransferase RlmH [Paeniglutamicibacter]MCV9995889.1 23S rRNA (pseudouridine(1915)-N(3))-methyltransferase RlmH [Paeniglutamicibacter sp. ZC-3]MDO2933585.1 23S rRNA (pseudouridine(1915)-N(3))-methyltransferase RlmH [Paeniglutamicibacter sulfureus]MDR7358006.1 23S rRNA (pseudouridine1915-N3)-methyltransferase [Paeniglutamicibacter sulfureus]
MTIRVLAIGKKHESWVTEGIERYEKRMKKPFDLKWQLLPHSAREGDSARAEESERILAKVDSRDFLVLLDERGKNIDSPTLAKTLQRPFDTSRNITVVIGGAYGVDESVHSRADFVWSLSKLVFPHQLVRLILTEQLYRAQEISGGGKYHHV